MYCPTFRNAKVKVATADRSTDMLFCAKTTPPDCSSILPQGLKYVAVRLLNGGTYYFVVDINNRAVQLFYQVCNMLKIGKTELFGLAVLSDGVYTYVDQDLKICKYASKSWRTQHGNGVDIKGNILTFYFRVEIYVDCHMLINDKIARHHYYLQLKENLMTYSQLLNEEKIFLLAAYALQADFGNYNSKTHTGKYFDPHKYFPPSIITRVGEAYIIQHAPAMHEDNTGLSCGEAEISYIKEASDPISPLNLHFYKMNTKKSKEPPSIWLGISPVGIEIYKEEVQKIKTHISSFLWADMSKLFFDKRKFEIRSCGYPEERKFVYYASSEEAAKNLLRLSKESHLYYLATRTQVQAFKKIELEGRKKFRESYIYSDISELDREQTQRDSGVVSDKTTREEQVEDASYKVLKQYHTKAKNINSRSPCVRVGAYESFMQSDSGHSSFAENRSSSASPDVVTPSWREKSHHNSPNFIDSETNISLSSIPFPSNQVVSPDVGDVESSNMFQKTAGAKSFFSEFISKCRNDIGEPSNSQSSEASQNQNSLGECSVINVCDNNQQYIINNNVLNYSDSSKDQMTSILHQPASSFALCGRTRIGVSSLCHQPHKNTIGILQRHGEKPQCIDIEYKSLFKTKQNLSSDSGVSSPSNGTLNGKSERCSVCCSHLESKERLNSVNDNQENSTAVLSSLNTVDDAFPCIPPPPGYENSSEVYSNGKAEHNIRNQLNSKESGPPKLSEHTCQSPSNEIINTVIDLQLLRQKSQDLGLPLISGLCNDRSLLMLPKTVPTCSRNRHLGLSCNPRRFSCSSVNPVCTNETTECLSGKVSCTRGRSHTSPEIRPTTWHVDMNFPWANIDIQKDIHSPLQGNSNDTDYRNKRTSTQETLYNTSSPPSILTSFSNSVNGHSPQQNICTTASRQMIPTKLSSAFGNTGNTRLLAK